MLRLVLILLLFASGISFSQSKIDQRLLDNLGQEIEEIHQFRPDYYNYLVYELNNGFELIDKKKVKTLTNSTEISLSKVVNKKGEQLSLSAIKSPDFNFKAFGLEVKLKSKTLIKIDKNNFLLIKTKLEIANEFSKSPLSHK